MNGPASAILLLALFAVLCLPRRLALTGMVVGILYLTQNSGLEIGGLNLFPTRILSYACFFRVLGRREFSFSVLTPIDRRLVLLYALVSVVLFGRADDSWLFVTAKLLDVLCAYFAFRGLIKSTADFRWFLQLLTILLVPYVALLAIERLTGNNPFEFVGGRASEWVRGDKVRCFGSFRHPSLLGSLGATFFPLFIALVWTRKLRRTGFVGAILCVAVVVFSNSGGPVGAWAVGVVGLFLWRARDRMQMFRRGLVAAVIVLALIMKAPVFYLIARVSSVTGGGGWHRAHLMDVGFQKLNEWWLIGLPIRETRGWAAFTLAATGGVDVTNQFLAFGLSAGVLGIVLFIMLISAVFRSLGEALVAARAAAGTIHQDQYLLWGLGVMQAVHVVNWLGITYFDQFETVWLLQLAAVASVTQSVLAGPDFEDGAQDVHHGSFEDLGSPTSYHGKPREAQIFT